MPRARPAIGTKKSASQHQVASSGLKRATRIESRKIPAIARRRALPRPRLLGRDLAQAGAPGVGEEQDAGEDDADQVDRVEDDGGLRPTVVTEDLAAEGDQHDPGEVEEVEHDQAPVEAGDVAEEAVVDEPEAADHGEADRVGEEVPPLFQQRFAEIVVGDSGLHPQLQDQQRDRDREDAVAEGDDARELNLVLVPLLGGIDARHDPIIKAGRDGTRAAQSPTGVTYWENPFRKGCWATVRSTFMWLSRQSRQTPCDTRSATSTSPERKPADRLRRVLGELRQNGIEAAWRGRRRRPDLGLAGRAAECAG